jgi:hypothetical protein
LVLAWREKVRYRLPRIEPLKLLLHVKELVIDRTTRSVD